MCVYTHMVRIVGTLGNYDQRRLWKKMCIVNPFDLFFFNHKHLSFHWRIIILNGGKYHYEMYFLKYVLDTITGTHRTIVKYIWN